jgi:hypothetical protein
MSEAETSINSWTQYEEALKAANGLNKTAVFDALAAAGVTRVEVTFNGEGDSGQIEDVVARRAEEAHPIPKTLVPFHSASYGSPETKTSEKSLAQAIEALCYDYLEQEHGGWENNDGGSGDFVFHVEDRRIELEFSQVFTDSTQHSHTF